LLLAERDLLSVDGKQAGAGSNLNWPAAVNTVELEQVGGGNRTAFSLVDMDDRKFRAIETGA
jgi:hypothetical protein